MRKGHGLVIHTHDCPISKRSRNDPNKWIDVEWSPDSKKLFTVFIRVLTQNGKGVLARIASQISEAEANIETVNFEPSDTTQYAEINFSILVADRIHLAKVMRKVRGLSEVVRITRLKK